MNKGLAAVAAMLAFYDSGFDESLRGVVNEYISEALADGVVAEALFRVTHAVLAVPADEARRSAGLTVIRSTKEERDDICELDTNTRQAVPAGQR